MHRFAKPANGEPFRGFESPACRHDVVVDVKMWKIRGLSSGKGGTNNDAQDEMAYGKRRRVATEIDKTVTMHTMTAKFPY